MDFRKGLRLEPEVTAEVTTEAVENVAPTSCENAPAIRATVGTNAFVISPTVPNRIRSAPSTNGDILGEIAGGAEFSVIGGPACDGTYTWFEIDYNGVIGWTAEGTLGVDNAQFVLRISAGWTIQQCLLFRDLEDPDLWLGTDTHGRWGEMNGAHRTELDGCTDIDFVNTPFTNCIPIRRLPLVVGHSATLSVAVIDIETLGITKQTHQYTISHDFP